MLPALLALIAGLGFCWFCASHHAPMIQADILSRTSQALETARIPATGVSVDGRDVLLKGYRGSPEVSDEAQRIARQTWGNHSVRVEILERPAPPPPPPAAEVQSKINEIIRLKNIEFLTGKAELTPASVSTLDEVAAALIKSPALTVAIGGHTDSQGNPGANQELSQARANTVRNYLISKGVAGTRMTAAGFGQTKPIADNATPDGRQRNRRIEFSVTGGGTAEVLPASSGPAR